MNLSIVWIDGIVAKIYHFSDDRMERRTIHVDPDPAKFGTEMSGHLRDSRQIVLLSPNFTGRELETVLKAEHPEIGRRIVGCEALADAHDARIAEYAVRYFRKPIKAVSG